MGSGRRCVPTLPSPTLNERKTVSCLAGVTRIGDNKRVAQVEMIAEEQLLVLLAGTSRFY